MKKINIFTSYLIIREILLLFISLKKKAFMEKLEILAYE